ncbi:hypothetical protein [Arthrospira platensis]|jgi:hypothetical protein|uniref:Arrestin C-terminal-like domain-containing protein n=1 Tax=Limnospira platensis NIES-46 TaxID=1236695 RepID=A0A5M3T144_LIMPL|nr:hypothetical protein [Arthrospira platensis]AMW29594.1 hypothetical protein AP285_18360 [Arthrospira platensis YZ]MBD2670927.1 hypothetical protein [Arthrospira platensis FACHB-439]MBD2708785.1 hypothetical protein [Arthrospira platensis FACHB-835]MDF2212446.1 hypothetical protein [Arthrospira platensis NCB002]QQW27521.1 hypothetical protein AP9108_20150 [Arthrospira sp. PCC 9108]BAI91991.1 hypothetical protein NIES39_K03450 [Arthrospira platensis NIES-39]
MYKWIEKIKIFLGFSTPAKSLNKRRNQPSKVVKNSSYARKNQTKTTNHKSKKYVEYAKIKADPKKPKITVEQLARKPIEEQFTPSSRDTFQQKLNVLPDNSTIQLWPPNAEYPGPIVINHPIILDGKGATLWSKVGPVILIESQGVSLKNLRIEVTAEERNSYHDQCAILVKSRINLRFENVQVRGSVMGLPEEEGEWQYPASLNLGQLPYGTEYNFILKIFVPIDCKILTDISGLNIQNDKLEPGLNSINITLDKMLEDTLLSGSILIVSGSFQRRIAVTAYISSVTEDSNWAIPNSILWEPETVFSNISNPTSQAQLDPKEPDIIYFPELPDFDSSPIPSDITEIQDSLEIEPTPSWSSSRIRQGETVIDGIFTAETNRLDAEAEQETEPNSLQLPELFSQSSDHGIDSPSKSRTSSTTQSSSPGSIFEEKQFQSQPIKSQPDPSVTNLDTSKYISSVFSDNLPSSTSTNSENLPDPDPEKLPTSELSNTDVETDQHSHIRRVKSNKISSVFGNIDNIGG